MGKYRFKTLEEFKEDNQWCYDPHVVPLRGYPEG
jgi:hypothetical protein